MLYQTGSRLQKYWYHRPNRKNAGMNMLQMSVRVIKLINVT